jgi:methyl-accepting chemotaxis protein
MKKVWTVKARILSLVGAAVAAMVLLTAVNIYSVESGIQTLSSVYEHRVQPVESIQEIDRDLKEVRFRMAGVLLDQMPAVGSNNQLKEAAQNVPLQWQHFKEAIKGNEASAETRELIAKIDQQMPAFSVFCQKLSAAYETDDANTIKPLLEDEWPAIHAGLLKPIGQLAEQQTAAVKSTYQASQTSGSRLLSLAILAFLSTTILIGAISYFTVRAITTPLAQLVAAAQAIGKSGDLDQNIQVDRDDEIGELARSFAAMVSYLKEMAAISKAIAQGDLQVAVESRSERDTLGHAFEEMLHGLRSLVSSVRDAASQVASSSTQVADASGSSARASLQASSAIDEVTSTMHEMTASGMNVAENTRMQASSVAETSASIDQMVVSIQRVADTAKLLLQISGHSRKEVESGIETMKQASDGLSRINTSIENSAEITSVLGRRLDDIGKIIVVIDEISDQTNLLALNAAIEAARAGEHGLGFAVVADEVRKLAEKSAQSTREVGELIRGIQEESRMAVQNMQRSTSIVDEGLNLGTQLSQALSKISGVVTEVYKLAQEIGAATTEQSGGSSQIAKATSRLNEITHEINFAVEEQSTGAQAVVKAMERMREMVSSQTSSSTELAAASEQMSKMAADLVRSMERFTLGADDGFRSPAFLSRREPKPRSAAAHA